MSGASKRRSEHKPEDRLDKELRRLQAEIASVPPRPDLVELTNRLKAALKNKPNREAR